MHLTSMSIATINHGILRSTLLKRDGGAACCGPPKESYKRVPDKGQGYRSTVRKYINVLEWVIKQCQSRFRALKQRQSLKKPLEQIRNQ